MLYILNRKDYVFITTKTKKQHIKIRREGGRGVYICSLQTKYMYFCTFHPSNNNKKKKKVLWVGAAEHYHLVMVPRKY